MSVAFLYLSFEHLLSRSLKVIKISIHYHGHQDPLLTSLKKTTEKEGTLIWAPGDFLTKPLPKNCILHSFWPFLFETKNFITSSAVILNLCLVLLLRGHMQYLIHFWNIVKDYVEYTLIFWKESSKYSEISLNVNLPYILEIPDNILTGQKCLLDLFESF